MKKLIAFLIISLTLNFIIGCGGKKVPSTWTDNKIKIGKWFDILVIFFVPLQFLAMIGWWFWQSYSDNPHNWFKIFSPNTVVTVLFQWIIALILFILLE